MTAWIEDDCSYKVRAERLRTRYRVDHMTVFGALVSFMPIGQARLALDATLSLLVTTTTPLAG